MTPLTSFTICFSTFCIIFGAILLYYIATRCKHNYVNLETFSLIETGRKTPVGKIYVSQCSHCKKILQSKVNG